MCTQPPAQTEHSTTPQAASDPTTEDTQTRDPRTVSDAQAVEMMRRWAEDAQADPEQHSSFIKVARIFIDTLTAEATREKQHRARGTGRLKSYEIQPVGVPSPASVTFNGDDIYDLFETLLAAVQAWRHSDDVIEDDDAIHHLLGLTHALTLLARARIKTSAPLTDAHRADERAAEEWTSDRWMGRSDPKRAPAGSIVATNATERSAS